jgi:hypothetical protein
LDIKSIVTIIANIGGFLALIDFAGRMRLYFGHISALITDVWDVDVTGPKKQIHNAHIVLTNDSSRTIFVYSMTLTSADKSFSVATSGGFLMLKKFENYQYPVFRTPFPITLNPRSTVDLRVEVNGTVNWKKLTGAALSTQHGNKKVSLQTTNLKSVDQYQFR